MPVRRQLPETDIYGITASELSRGRSNLEVVREMLEAGVRLVQYREKMFGMRRKYQECIAIRDLCARYGACFIINDDVGLALAVEADGIHVGQEDLPVEKTRELAGEKLLLGLSISTWQEADEAIRSPLVDYLGAGPIYTTATKKDAAQPGGLEYLDYVVQRSRVPVVAIGGINLGNAAEAILHGASCLAIISDIVCSDDIGARVRAIRQVIAGARAGRDKQAHSPD